ncbi:hypothetical protein L228DRAFT_286031 [Xylona heveae TC161]|uniref:ATP-dependent bile acid permease n=1 Tax=Xylona heveae (strain CBS 132557 / TC161) TaxID=1328760 RepID=A0A164ZJB9_XYLHT|nr:hypothetical protein L228DRAFT_286031 [Xylona heveae TC161]KZF19169.1 hypothetical protein L228DRAFT_286031 [Xylona heveae TC161]
MFGHCKSPVWRQDDFTGCFQRDFLQILLPLIICTISLVFLSYQTIQIIIRARRAKAYHQLATSEDAFGIPRYEDMPEEEENGDEAPSEEDESDVDEETRIREHHMALDPTLGPQDEPVVEVDRPRGEVLVVLVENLAILGEIGISLTALLTHAWGKHGSSAAITGLATWGYIFAIAFTRLLLSSWKKYTFHKLWYHTALLYVFQWAFTLLLFRSAIIHPRSKLAQRLVIGDFILATLLAIIALTTRKGNKAVALEREENLEPSHETRASALSLATFSWVDAIVYTGYRKSLELSDVWNLTAKDKAARVLAEYRQVQKTNALAFHLLRYFGKGLIYQALLAAASGFLMFVPTLLLRAILQYVENPGDTPANAAWFYVILLFVSGCCSALADGQALWIGRKICIRLRAIIVGEIYAKALRRKAAAGTDTVLGHKPEDEENAKPGLMKRAMTFVMKKKKKPDMKADQQQSSAAKVQADSQANVGTIINLMAVDSFKVSEISAYLHFLWASTPIQVVVAVTLLYRIMGYSSIAGIVTMVCLLPINIVVAKQFTKVQKAIMAATDARIHTTNEVLQNIRIIKFFAWEERFSSIVDESRAKELKTLRQRYVLWSVAATIWSGAPVLITFLSFLFYTMVEKRDLIPSVAFTALSLFSLLRIPLDQLADMLAHVQEAKVSVDRVEEFLKEEETGKYVQLQHNKLDENGQPVIGFDHATFSWGSKSALVDNTSKAFRLIDLDIKFHVDQLSVITGPTGAGKSSLLMALLGEMTLVNGHVYLPGGHSRENLHPDPETGLIESVAYCAQQPWLANDTIKQNILFASPWDEQRYKAVLSACSLERDLKILDAGDETLVGEKGITLSGGQKQRISLARALYSTSRHVILDDCLSAVDSHTAKWIFDNCIMGPLMYNRTCIMVTHNVALCVPQAHHVVVMDNGKVTAQGAPQEIISSGILGEEMAKSTPASQSTSQAPSRVASEVGPLGKLDEANGKANGHQSNGGTAEAVDSTKDKKDPSADPHSEQKAVGRVSWGVVQVYLGSMGSWFYWGAAFVLFATQSVSSLANNIWIRQWANQYHYSQSNIIGAAAVTISDKGQYVPARSISSIGSCIVRGSCAWDIPLFSKKPSEIFQVSAIQDVNVPYYLGVYALLGIIFMFLTFSKEIMLFSGSLTASRKIHARLIESVTRAKLRFFDSTPLGQIMNRFSKDIESVDQEVMPVAVGVVHCIASVVIIVILISVITPGFLIAGVFISVIYFVIGRLYINSSTDLKRLESVQRSPLFQHFGETLTGMITIRAYGDERRFARDNLHRINTHNRPFIYLWATNRWLAFRVDITGALVSFFAGVFVILSIGKIDPGAAGLSLTYAITFTENVLWLVRLYAANEQNMNSVERIKEYLDVEQEAPAVIPDARPAANWPADGAVQFINYTTRYRPDFDPVLQNVSFKVLPGEKVGIVGRTGAGKSSLALALFRGLEAEEGKIIVDEVDIGLIGLKDLRQSINIVPQDPTLFTGTIRSNLDPFELFTDEEIFTALRRVHLISSPNPGSDSTTRPSTPDPTSSTADLSNSNGNDSQHENKNPFHDLNSPVAESGSNLSQGQRQLLCLARALLKSPKVLLMDEATASIDYATDAKIQRTIREIKGTIITIAHRLQTIIDYDKVLVLDKGRVIEYDDPWSLVSREDTVFRDMCSMSGDLALLLELAKKAHEGRRLVDTDA